MHIRVAVIEDHPLMMKAILDLLSTQPGIQVVGKSDHGSELPRLVREHSPDVVILDLGMSSGNFEPITAVRTILQDYPGLRILVLTGYDEEIYVCQVVEAGAYGYVLKSDDLSLMLPKGVQRVYEGKRFYSDDVIDKLFTKSKYDQSILTEQELVVLRLAAQGLSNGGIAEMIQVSEKRVRNILSNVYDKFNMHDDQSLNVRIAAINKARELGLLTSD